MCKQGGKGPRGPASLPATKVSTEKKKNKTSEARRLGVPHEESPGVDAPVERKKGGGIHSMGKTWGENLVLRGSLRGLGRKGRNPRSKQIPRANQLKGSSGEDGPPGKACCQGTKGGGKKTDHMQQKKKKGC